MTTRILTAKAQEKLDFAAAALGLARHQVTDPSAVDILERFAMDEISIEQAMKEIDRVFPNP